LVAYSGQLIAGNSATNSAAVGIGLSPLPTSASTPQQYAHTASRQTTPANPSAANFGTVLGA
jgi:hypothetical protein